MNSTIDLFEHFRLLFSFGGREDRGSFWPYAALAFGILTAFNMLMMIPMMMSLGNVYDTAITGNWPSFGLYFGFMIVLAVLLYSAAVARRLRDAGCSPGWVLLPLPFAIASCVGMTQAFQSPFDGIPPDTDLIPLMIAANAFYTLAVIALIVMLSLPSARGSSAKKDSAPREYHVE